MINRIKQDIEKYLPLIVEEVSWDDTILYIKGKDWSFVAMTSWRITHKGKLLLGSNENDINGIVRKIQKLQVVDFYAQSLEFPVDPTFVFSNGFILEVFSITGYDPWNLRSPSGMFYEGFADFEETFF